MVAGATAPPFPRCTSRFRLAVARTSPVARPRFQPSNLLSCLSALFFSHRIQPRNLLIQIHTHNQYSYFFSSLCIFPPPSASTWFHLLLPVNFHFHQNPSPSFSLLGVTVFVSAAPIPLSPSTSLCAPPGAQETITMSEFLGYALLKCAPIVI
jgi:hypothetical protein